MGATDQYGKRFVFPMLVFFVARGFASAEASRGLSDRPRHPFGAPLWEHSFIRAVQNKILINRKVNYTL
jgi:hypothetical protein